MTRALRLLVSVGITLSSAIPAAGQWLNHPSQGIPLTSDGRSRSQCAAAADGGWTSGPLGNLGVCPSTLHGGPVVAGPGHVPMNVSWVLNP